MMLFILRQSKNTEKNYAVKEAEGLFYQEHLFSNVVRIGVGVVSGLVFIGLVWEFSCRRRKHGMSRVSCRKCAV